MTVTYRTMKPLNYVMCAIAACGAAWPQDASLSVSVLSGNDVVVSTREGRGADIKVRVTGPNNQPLEDATVTAILPAIGAGGSFSGGDTIKSKTTNSEGTVDFTGIHIRPTTGEIPVRIVARLGKQTGSTTAYQKAADVAPPATPEIRLSRRRMAMFGIIAGGVTAAVLAATLNGDSPSQPAFSVTPGTPVTTGPR
jgi:hypothetical protein